MKPRIRLRRKVWDCRLPDYRQTRVWGFGMSPTAAYRDWLRQMVQGRFA